MEIINLKPYLPKDFNVDNIVYSDVQHDGPNKKSVFLYDSEPNKKIYIQSPELMNVISITKKSKYYELNLPLYGKKQNHISSFIEFIRKLDNKIMSDAKINKNTWFEESNKNVRYRSLIKNIHNDYIDTIEHKSGMFENGIIKLKITDTTSVSINSETIKPEALKLNHGVKTIFQVYAIWISENLFGIYLKPIKIDQKIKIIEQIDFIMSDSDKDTVYNTDVDNLSDISDSEEQNNSDSDNTQNDSSEHYMNSVNIVNVEDNNLKNILKVTKESLDEFINSDSISLKTLSSKF
jgi:hypothetical protein